ncbi:metallophosphoesterase family protein [Kocuria carniphila]|uniref:metallophosphoesterase family protein n=2 Tax=Micrococcaceae TaxID=1268 RepID=UPI0034DAC291
MSENTPRPSRRNLITGGSALAAAGVLSAAPVAAQAAPATVAQHRGRGRGHGQMPLSFGKNGAFKIVQFNDTQDGPRTDRRTLEFMGKVLDREKPQFALINGDVINGSPRTNREVKQAINNVVMPMESRGIKWAVTFGNHDEDSTEDNGTGMYEPQLVEFVRQYQHNLNPGDDQKVFGSSNAQLLIRGSRGNAPAFAVWLLDSGRYAEDKPGGQDREGLMGYDWIRPQQIRWYNDLSEETERRYGKKIPGLMYFHIPTWEHHHMWYGQQFSSDDDGHAAAVKRHGIVGEKHENVYTGMINSGIYAAAKERGDILGMYCGHDHINTYMGNYFGIELGYGPGTGFGTYGLNDGTRDEHTLRGARVFELNERTERVYTGTRLIFAKDLGIDMAPETQPLARPVRFPRYVRG